MSISPCCIQGSAWEGIPSGRCSKLGNNDVYITGDNPDVAILFTTDLFGWTFPNARLLADYYATEIGATVYVPDFFGGEILDFELLSNEQFHLIDLAGFMSRNGRQQRESEIFECARLLKQQLGYQRVGAVGYCYGGWASFRLGAKEHTLAGQSLVDCVSIGHPSLLTKTDIDEVAVPVQILAPEIDQMYSAELKLHTFKTLQSLQLPFDYQHFPGVVHACLVRGDKNKPGERAAMSRGKHAVVAWFKQFLKDSQ